MGASAGIIQRYYRGICAFVYMFVRCLHDDSTTPVRGKLGAPIGRHAPIPLWRPQLFHLVASSSKDCGLLATSSLNGNPASRAQKSSGVATKQCNCRSRGVGKWSARKSIDDGRRQASCSLSAATATLAELDTPLFEKEVPQRNGQRSEGDECQPD
jgi:hypothetical protein